MQESILLPHLAPRGFRTAPRPEAPELEALLTGGDVPAEYAAAREGCALFDATDRGELRLTGLDAPDLLHRILANRVRDLAPGTGCRNLLLTPKGKVRFDLDLSVGDGEIRLSVTPGRAAALAAAIDGFVFTEAVEIEETTATHAPLEVCGPKAREVLEQRFGAWPPLDDHASTRVVGPGGETILTPLTVAGVAGWRIDAGPDGALATWDALTAAGATPCGIVVRDILRVEAAAALSGVDVDDNVYPQEANLTDAFSLDKGCYVGQEVVAKIDTYGGANKLLLPLRINHDDPVPRGTRLLREVNGERRDVGMVTSWAYSFLLDTGLVLAYVKRKHQDEGTLLHLEGDAGTATIVPAPAG